MTNKDFLLRAVRLAEEGIENGSGPFAAIVVRNGKTISESNNLVVKLKDPTAHAEILAIREAARLSDTHDLKGCVMYSSCEPCPMCLGAIYWSGIREVYYAADRKDAAASGFNDKFIYDEISVPPEMRKLYFKKIIDIDGSKVFRKWDMYDKKIPY